RRRGRIRRLIDRGLSTAALENHARIEAEEEGQHQQHDGADPAARQADRDAAATAAVLDVIAATSHVPPHARPSGSPYSKRRAVGPRRIHHSTAAWIGTVDASASTKPIAVPTATMLTLSTKQHAVKLHIPGINPRTKLIAPDDP